MVEKILKFKSKPLVFDFSVNTGSDMSDGDSCKSPGIEPESKYYWKEFYRIYLLSEYGDDALSIWVSGLADKLFGDKESAAAQGDDQLAFWKYALEFELNQFSCSHV